MIPHVFAVVGLCGTGKSEATNILLDLLAAERVYFGGFVSAELVARGLTHTPENERHTREELRREHGMGVVARLALSAIRDALAAGRHVVIDGLYSQSEYELLKSEFGEALTTIALHTPRTTRYERMRRRAVRPFSPDQVDQRDATEIREIEKAPPIVLADHHVVNASTLQHLQSELASIVSGQLGVDPKMGSVA